MGLGAVRAPADLGRSGRVTPTIRERTCTDRPGDYSPNSMTGGLLGLYESLSKLMSRHRLASFVITAATLLLMADATRRVISDDAQFNLLTWIALALMA
jgi:hypothetical protein